MKNVIVAMLCLLAISSSAQENVQTSTGKKYVIPEGTLLRVKSLTSFDSKTVHEGDMIDFATIDDFEVDGVTLIKEGAIVNSFVESAEHAKGIGKKGTLKVQFNYTKAIDGTKIPLRSTKGTIQGEDKAGGAIALAVVVSPLFLLKKGKEAKVTEGKIMEAYVNRDVTITIPNTK
jgi:hypothetical protein